MALTTYCSQSDYDRVLCLSLASKVGIIDIYGRNGSASVTLLKQAQVGIVADAVMIGIFISLNVLSKVADCYKVCQMLFHFFYNCKHTFSCTHKQFCWWVCHATLLVQSPSERVGYRCWQVQLHVVKQLDPFGEPLAGEAGQENDCTKLVFTYLQTYIFDQKI